jgi:hypothetical protein
MNYDANKRIILLSKYKKKKHEKKNYNEKTIYYL